MIIRIVLFSWILYTLEAPLWIWAVFLFGTLYGIQHWLKLRALVGELKGLLRGLQ